DSGARTFPVSHLSDTKWHLRHAFAGGGWCNGARLVGFCTTLVHRKNDESPGQSRFLRILCHLANPQRIHMRQKVYISICENRVDIYEDVHVCVCLSCTRGTTTTTRA